jgi:allantoin racemase
MSGKIYVINPNSTESVTRSIEKAIESMRLVSGPEIECITLVGGPVTVQTQVDVDTLAYPLCNKVRELDKSAAAFVIACFSDPGMYSVREVTAKPVLGIAECGILTAMTFGHRIGVMSILSASIPRHLRYFGAMGLSARVVADRAIERGVLSLADAEATFQRMREVGLVLRDTDGANVIVMGCAGMASFRQRLEEALDVPVVDPTQAAVGMALGRVLRT